MKLLGTKTFAEKGGQATLEVLMSGILIVTTSCMGLGLIIQGLGTVVATKWAAKNSRCVAVSKAYGPCESKVKKELVDYFKFKEPIDIQVTRPPGAIRTEIRGTLGPSLWSEKGLTVRGVYELYAFEYKQESP